MELHTVSLLPNTESIVTVSRSKRYPKRFAGNLKLKKPIETSSKKKNRSVKRKGVLTPEETKKKRKKNIKSSFIIERSESHFNNRIITWTGRTFMVGSPSVLDNEKLPTLQELCGMALISQLVLPNQFITSNIAEQFNALHDREQVYWGRKFFYHVNQDLLAWVILRFYPKGAEKILSHTDWKISSNLLSVLLPLGITHVEFP